MDRHEVFTDETGEDGATLVRSEENWTGALTNVSFAAKMIGASASRMRRSRPMVCSRQETVPTS